MQQRSDNLQHLFFGFLSERLGRELQELWVELAELSGLYEHGLHQVHAELLQVRELLSEVQVRVFRLFI